MESRLQIISDRRDALATGVHTQKIRCRDR